MIPIARLGPLAACLALLVPAAPPAHAQRAGRVRVEPHDVVEFKLFHPLSVPSEAVFVLGSLAELGEGELTRAVKLESADDASWRVAIALPLDRTYWYRFFVRSTRAADLRDPANGVPISPEVRAKTRRSLLGPGQKALQVHTSLVDPLLHWRQDGGPFTSEALEPLGSGRVSGEERRGLRAFALGGRPVEFYLTSGDGSVRDPADPDVLYRTPLDAFFLQDGQLFTYTPAPVVGPHRRASMDPFVIHSSILAEDRHYRVMLPRGYDEHPGRRYPVLYLYDGQTAWQTGPFSGQFGIWDRDGNRLAALVARGAVGEVLQVAIDYIEEGFCDALISRGRDCISPEDTVNDSLCGRVTGMADQFLRFVTEELKPHVDATYRTLPDRAHTFVTGYSLGGVFALYSGWEFTDTFGAIGAQSGSFWIPDFPARVQTERRADLRVYLDTGDTENSIFGPANRLRTSFVLDEGRVLGRDLGFAIGYSQTHSYLNGGLRMESLMTFLWPGTSED
ncbi:MAG TPA: alpha/beta hydrolase-fold protein, partial [Planctomycetota bacterium]